MLQFLFGFSQLLYMTVDWDFSNLSATYVEHKSLSLGTQVLSYLYDIHAGNLNHLIYDIHSNREKHPILF